MDRLSGTTEVNTTNNEYVDFLYNSDTPEAAPNPATTAAEVLTTVDKVYTAEHQVGAEQYADIARQDGEFVVAVRSDLALAA